MNLSLGFVKRFLREFAVKFILQEKSVPLSIENFPLRNRPVLSQPLARWGFVFGFYHRGSNQTVMRYELQIGGAAKPLQLSSTDPTSFMTRGLQSRIGNTGH